MWVHEEACATISQEKRVLIMVMVKFKEGVRCGVFNLEQIKVSPCGKVVAPFGMVQMRECEIVEYIK
jgi:hypothetical protein